MRIIKHVVVVGLIAICASCNHQKPSPEKLNPKATLENAEKQIEVLLASAEKANKIPRTLNSEGEMHWTNDGFDWTEGFFPGTCWYFYELTKNEKWKKAAEKFQAFYEDHKYSTANHDLGFIFNCSYGNGYRLTQNKDFKEVMITAGDSLITRFNENVGCIQSWDVDRGWQAERGWKFPVIIDNMMNLELLFELTELTGNETYKNIAIAHADTTLKNHFREDDSSYHVIDYDPETGEIRNRHTAQGYSHESSWARGQAWGIYGFTLCYRYTKDERYLEQAQKIADFIINYKGIPEDGIPYWDYNAPNIPNEPRDASAAAITVSALIELNGYTDNAYATAVDKIMNSLASKAYTAENGENYNFLLKHSVGSIPHNNEIDVPLNYADYYYIEALMRLQKLQ
jgi:rhamnogalacturonyl hydrolase YesR